MVAASAATIAAIWGCGGNNQGSRLDTLAKEALANRRPLNLQRVAPNSWDRLFVFGAYTPPTTIEQTLGFKWKDAANQSPTQDAVSLYVFTRASSVVESFQSGALNAGCLYGTPLARAQSDLTVKSIGGATVVVGAPDRRCDSR